MSAAIVQDGRIVWDKGFGYQDVDASVAATATTPYPISDLSQTFASTLLLQRCHDSGRLELSDRVRRWISQHPEDSTTVAQLLRHASPSGGFMYDAARFASLSSVVKQCTSEPYLRVISGEILDRLGMADSMPSHDLSGFQSILTDSLLARYSSVLQRLAVPYRVDSDRRPVRSEYQPQRVNGSTGIVSTVRDLARFDIALSDGVLVSAETLDAAWTTTAPCPLGWAGSSSASTVSASVWHFGLAKNAYSSLFLKVPGRGLTLILLANSDGLMAPAYDLSDGDVSSNLFASLFLGLFVE